jgi:hypothetical protein
VPYVDSGGFAYFARIPGPGRLRGAARAAAVIRPCGPPRDAGRAGPSAVPVRWMTGARSGEQADGLLRRPEQVPAEVALSIAGVRR